MATKQFPKTLYAKIEKDGDTSYFVAVADEGIYGLAEHGKKIKVATYKLIEVNSVDLVADVRKVK
jgi:hypothetical protein